METIPFYSLEFQHRQIEAQLQKVFQDVYRAGSFVSGKKLIDFEREFAARHQVNYAIGVGNGLDALSLSLLALEIGKGDEVIVPANTYIATWLAITRVGAVPLPVEPLKGSMNIDPDKVRQVINSKTKAVLPVHLYGQACDMSSIQDIARKNNLHIVEDNAQAYGSRWNGQVTGSWGRINATSFYPTKTLGALGDGGCVTTDEEGLARCVRELANYGFEQKNIANRIGLNSRLDEIQAAFLTVKLSFVDNWIEQKRKMASQYFNRLNGLGDLVLPSETPGGYHTYHLYVVRTAYRDKLKQFLHEHHIETQIHYPIPPHLQKAYAHLGFAKGSFPVTESIAASALSLPIWPGLSEDDINRICDTISKFFRDHL